MDEISNALQRLEGFLYQLRRASEDQRHEAEKQNRALRNVEIVIAEIRSKLSEVK